jgi:hypothetical protein
MIRSKTIALFLALGMAASVTACANEPAEVEGGEGTPEVEEITPEAAPGTEGTEGGEGGEGGEG